MDQLIRQNRETINKIVRAEAPMWHIQERDLEDVTQETLLRTFQGWKPSRKDPQAHFLSLVYLNAHTTMIRLAGFHNGYKRPQQARAVGEKNTYAVGLYQPSDEGDDLIMDERILPTVPSAEDAYMATLPNKRQAALREAIDGLPEPYRTVMKLQTYEELSVAETASRLGMTNTQVSLLRSEGMKRLRRRLNPGG